MSEQSKQSALESSMDDIFSSSSARGADEPEEDVVSSTPGGASSGGKAGSPLLDSLLKETLREAEREKTALDNRIREKEHEERRRIEEEVARKRAEMQKRLEEEQRRRDDMVRAKEAKAKAAEPPMAQAGPELAAAHPEVQHKSSKGMLAAVVILALGLVGVGVFAYQLHTTMKANEATAAANQKKLEAANTTANAEIVRLTGELGKATEAYKNAAAAKLVADGEIAKLQEAKAGLEADVTKLTEEKAALQVAVETKDDAAGATAPVAASGGSKKPKSNGTKSHGGSDTKSGNGGNGGKVKINMGILSGDKVVK